MSTNTITLLMTLSRMWTKLTNGPLTDHLYLTYNRRISNQPIKPNNDKITQVFQPTHHDQSLSMDHTYSTHQLTNSIYLTLKTTSVRVMLSKQQSPTTLSYFKTTLTQMIDDHTIWTKERFLCVCVLYIVTKQSCWITLSQLLRVGCATSRGFKFTKK